MDSSTHSATVCAWSTRMRCSTSFESMFFPVARWWMFGDGSQRVDLEHGVFFERMPFHGPIPSTKQAQCPRELDQIPLTPERRGNNRDVSTEQRRHAAAVPGTPGSYSRSDLRGDAQTPAGSDVAFPRSLFTNCPGRRDRSRPARQHEFRRRRSRQALVSAGGACTSHGHRSAPGASSAELT